MTYDAKSNADTVMSIDPGSFVAITPSDSTVLEGCRGIYVGTAGNVALRGVNDAAAVTFSNVPAGSIIPGRIARVMATNTTASNIVGLY